MNIFGIPVLTSKHLPTKLVQVRFPRSKKKRIRKKWAKNPANWREADFVFMISREAVMSALMPKFKPESLVFVQMENRDAFEARYAGYWSGMDWMTGKKF